VTGSVIIVDPKRCTFEEREVVCPVVPGWLPDDPEGISAEMLSPPRFMSDREFCVTTANGQTVNFAITA